MKRIAGALHEDVCTVMIMYVRLW